MFTGVSALDSQFRLQVWGLEETVSLALSLVGTFSPFITGWGRVRGAKVHLGGACWMRASEFCSAEFRWHTAFTGVLKPKQRQILNPVTFQLRSMVNRLLLYARFYGEHKLLGSMGNISCYVPW